MMLLDQQSHFHFINRGSSCFGRWFVPSLRWERGGEQPLQRTRGRARRWRAEIARKCSQAARCALREPTTEKQAPGAVTLQPVYPQSTKQRGRLERRQTLLCPIFIKVILEDNNIYIPGIEMLGTNPLSTKTKEWTSLLLRWLLLLIDYGFLDTSSTFINILGEFLMGMELLPMTPARSRSSSS